MTILINAVVMITESLPIELFSNDFTVLFHHFMMEYFDNESPD